MPNFTLLSKNGQNVFWRRYWFNEMIKRLKPKSEFSRNVMVLMSGSIIAQAIPLLITPILTRLYTPEEFGVYALFFSAVSILTVIATARYEMAIMLPKSNRMAMCIVYLSVLISAFLAIFTLILVLIFYREINDWLGIEVAFLIPLMIFTAGIIQSLKIWLNRQKKYKEMAANRVGQSFFGGLSQLTLGLLNSGSLGLILGQYIGQFMAAIGLGIHINKSKFYPLNRRAYLRAISSFKRYFYLIKFGVPALLTSRAAQESLILLVGYFMSSGIVGFISLLNRVISVSASILGTNLGEVFYQKITETKKNKSYPLVKSFSLNLLVLSVPLYVISYFVLDYAFVWFFGDAWQDALEFMPYLLIVAAFSFIFSPISILFNYYEIQGWNLIWQFVWLSTNILIFLVYNYLNLSIQEVFLIYTIKQVMLYTIGILSFILYARKIYEK